MAKSNNDYYPKRVLFIKGEQRKFIDLVMEKLNANINKLAFLANVHPRSIRDWKREKLSVPLTALNIFCTEANLPMPKEIEIKEPFWYSSKGSMAGWLAVKKKYGERVPINEEHRKKKWYEWWEKEGQFKKNNLIHLLPFKKPRKSKELAEFFGIMMGDGGITNSQICVTLHHIDDLEYSKFVIKLMKKLFDILPSVYHIKKMSVNNIVISRSGLVKYLNSMGLLIGNKIKQGLNIPSWINKNRSYKIACLRGLVDTDGCIFIHKYKVKGKYYSYKKLSFTSYSKPLRDSVCFIMKNFGLNPRLAANRDVRLDSKDDIKNYFKIVGSHNPKHLRKYQLML